MGEMTKSDIVAELQRANPTAKQSDINIYADAFDEYKKAQANIDANGSVVFHPRTGAPIENPFTKVRDRASKVLTGMRRIKSDALW